MRSSSISLRCSIEKQARNGQLHADLAFESFESVLHVRVRRTNPKTRSGNNKVSSSRGLLSGLLLRPMDSLSQSSCFLKSSDFFLSYQSRNCREIDFKAGVVKNLSIIKSHWSHPWSGPKPTSRPSDLVYEPSPNSGAQSGLYSFRSVLIPSFWDRLIVAYLECHGKVYNNPFLDL